MSHKKPPPLGNESPPRKRCEVCGEVSYSHAGIHPQCAQQRSESLRRRRVKTPENEPPLLATPPKGSLMRRWDKTCPRCAARLHVRKKACDCGHVFGRPVAEP